MEVNSRGHNSTAREEVLRDSEVEEYYGLNVTYFSCAENEVPADGAVVGGCRNFDVRPSLRKWIC